MVFASAPTVANPARIATVPSPRKNSSCGSRPIGSLSVNHSSRLGDLNELSKLKAGKVLRGPIFSEPVRTRVATPMGEAMKIVGRGLLSGQGVDVILKPAQLARVAASPMVPRARARSSWTRLLAAARFRGKSVPLVAGSAHDLMNRPG